MQAFRLFAEPVQLIGEPVPPLGAEGDLSEHDSGPGVSWRRTEKCAEICFQLTFSPGEKRYPDAGAVRGGPQVRSIYP